MSGTPAFSADWVFRAHARASVIYGDPVWAAQEYAMQRGERRRGDYDPPIAEDRVEALVEQYRGTQARKDAAFASAAAEPPGEP